MLGPQCHHDINTYVMDLWCMVPFYDAYFCQALHAEGVACTLGSISFHLEPDYFRRRALSTDPGLCNVVSHLPINNAIVRRTLKLLEFAGNITALAIRLLLAQPDIIHVQWLPLAERGVPVELWFLRLVKRRGVKLVYTVHNVVPHDSGMHVRDRSVPIYRLMDALICHTRETRDRLIQNFGVDKEKIWVIPHGPLFYDFGAIDSQEAKRRLGFAPEHSVVLCQGNVKPYKGIEFLLDAWTRVHAHQPHATLVVAGTGDKRYIDVLTRKVNDLGIRSSVRLVLHYIPSEEIPIYYQACDVAVYTHREITQSGALMTGIAFGKQIITTDLAGFREALDDYHSNNAFTVEYGDVTGLAQLLVRVIDTSREHRGVPETSTTQNCRTSWINIARQTRCCYESLLGSADARRSACGTLVE